MSSQAKKVQCSRFEPQTWRKTLCKNCFKTKSEHTEETSDELRTPDVMADLALSPEVLSGDKIIVRRSLVTPPPMDFGDFVSLGRRGSENSSGRRTPIRDDIKGNTSGRSTPIKEVSERKVLDEQKSKDSDVVGAKGTTSGRKTPIVEEQKKGIVSKEEGREEPNSKEADVKLLKAKGTDIISAKSTPVSDESKGGAPAPTAKVIDTSDLSGTGITQSPKEAKNHSPLYLNGDLPAQTNQPSDSPALTSVTSPFKPAHVPPCPATATATHAPLSEPTPAPKASAPIGKKTPREVDIDAAAGESSKNSEGGSKEGKTSPSGHSESASSSAINNCDFRSPAVGLESEAAANRALLGAHAAPLPPPPEGSEVDGQPSVHERTSRSECTSASVAPCRSTDEKKAVDENKSSSRTGTSIATHNTPTPTSTSSSNNSSNSGINSAGQTSDAQTKIAKATAAAAAAASDSGAARSSYVQSLRIHLTSPVNTEVAASGGGMVGVGGSSPDGETKNSYGIRHGGCSNSSSSPAPAASNGPSLSAAAPTKQDAASDTKKFNAAAAAAAAASGVAAPPIHQLANKSSAGELRSAEISPQKTDADDDGAPNGLSASSVKPVVVVDPRRSSSDCSPSPPSLGRPKAEVSLSLNSGGGGGGFASATTAAFVNNNNNNIVGSPTSGGYQFVDPHDSRLTYSIIDEGGGGGGGKKGGTGGVGSNSSEGTFYYLTNSQEGTSADPPPFSSSSSSSEPPTPDQPRKKVTSLFHHVPGDSSPGYPEDGQQSPNLRWSGNDSPAFRNQADDEAAANYSNLGGGGNGFDQAYQQQQQPGSGRRRRRSRVISLDDTNGAAGMSGFDYQRSDAMMEGTRMVIDNLREKVAQMQDQCERLEREKGAVGDLLAAKKSDYELMKDHFSESISNLELEVQRLKSEKSRLLDKLQLPESERASLAAEENEIAELKRRLEEYENRYTEVVGENEDLKQEVRDLQLEMEEMHDQFREEETMEFRELQKELENTAKNCRILQFKLRKAERRTEQLESDRGQYDEKLRQYESCFQSSDDKRRIRVLEEDLRLAKESSVRLHAEVERAEERKIKHQEELDRAKNSVNEADNKRLCLQNELDSMKHEMLKLRDQLRFDGRQEVIKTGGVYKVNVPETDSVAQLTKDLKDSVERENDLKEQLKFSEEENATMRKKLVDMEEETESMSLQLRKLSSAKSGRFTKGVKAIGGAGGGGGGDQGLDSEAAAATEGELRLQMELAEQEVKVLKRKMDELQQDNDNLLCAIKYLRSKLEQRDGARSATPIGDSKSTRDLLTKIGAAAAAEEEEAAAAGGGGSDGAKQQLVSSQKEVLSLKEQVEALEKEKMRLADEIQKLKTTGADLATTPCVNGTSSDAAEKEKNLMKTIEELEHLLMQEKEKVQLATSEKQTLISNVEKEKEELKTTSELKTKMESMQKSLSDLQAERDDLVKEKSKSSSSGSAANGVLSKDKEPASWRWEKQELEKQVNELKKKFEDLQAEKKKSPAKSKDNGNKVTDDSKDFAKLTEECEGQKKQLEELKKKLAEVEEKLKKTENEKAKASKELEKAGAATKDKTEVVSKSKDVGISFNDDSSTSTEKKKLTKELEEEKKRYEELVKERDVIIKEKESWTSEKKKLVLERDAAIKEKDELAAKTGKDSNEVKVSTPFGLRSKVGFGGKVTDAADSAKIKELTETLEKKEAELKALKLKAETKGPGERLGFQAKELSDLKKEKERLEQDLDKSTSERKTLKADIQQLKEKLKSSEETWNKERLRLEQDVKQVNEKTKPLTKTFRGSDESSKQEKETLIKEKLKLIEDVTKLKKDLGEVDQKRTLEKESFEKTLKEKTKALDETKTTCDGLHKEIERLNAQVAGSKSTSTSSASSSKVVTIPVQSDRSASKTTIPIQKISSSRSSLSNSSEDLHQTANLAALEETYRSRTRTLEDELDGLREQLTSVQKDSEAQAVKSQKTFTELKTNFDKELTSWNKERELLKKSGKLADEYGSKVTNLDKTVEELSGKLKAEEARRRELEVRLLAQENAVKVDRTSTPTTEEKPKTTEDKSATGPKSLEFRNRFEKFGGTPRPVRKLSLPSSTSTTPSSSDSGEKGGDWVGEIQRQMNEAEKARITDREELLEKMERQKKDFELKLEAFKETTKMLDTRSQDLSTLEKKMTEVQCQMEEERSKWVKERTKLQTKLDNVQQKGREDKDKVAELTGEVKKLQLLSSSGKGATSMPSGTSTPLTPSTPMGSEKPSFRMKSLENLSSSTSTHPTTSIVIPIRKIEDKKTPSSSSSSSSSSSKAEDGATSPAVATSNGVGKLSKKLFPFATDPQTISNTSTKSYTPGQRTPIPINRISRSNPPKL